jgi:hypothetical protein
VCAGERGGSRETSSPRAGGSAGSKEVLSPLVWGEWGSTCSKEGFLLPCGASGDWVGSNFPCGMSSADMSFLLLRLRRVGLPKAPASGHTSVPDIRALARPYIHTSNRKGGRRIYFMAPPFLTEKGINLKRAYTRGIHGKGCKSGGHFLSGRP